MKNDVMKAKEGSSNRGVFAVKFCEIICGSGMLSVQFASLCHATFLSSSGLHDWTPYSGCTSDHDDSHR